MLILPQNNILGYIDDTGSAVCVDLYLYTNRRFIKKILVTSFLYKESPKLFYPFSHIDSCMYDIQPTISKALYLSLNGDQKSQTL